MKKKRAGRPLQWHPAFYAGVQIELAQEAENLFFENEHQLGTKPKVIDILKRMSLDADSVYQEIINTEAYANVTKERVMKYW